MWEHGPALDAAEHLRTGLRAELGWSAHGGLSQSFSASRLAAKAEDQVRLIEAGQEAPFLAPFPIGALTALEARSRERLQHFGLHRVAQVQPMEIDALGRIIPPTEAFRVLRQARGEDQDRLPPLEVVQASETLRKIIMPPAHRHDLGVASWAWEAAWAWRLDGRFLHRLRLSWWDMDDLHHTLAFRMGGEDLWTCCRALELKFMAEATRRVLIQRMELEAWLQAVMASRWLTRLYRTLRDDHQAATAIQAGAPAEERLKRLGLHGRVSSMDVLFNQDHPEEIQAEEAAWTALIEGHAGLPHCVSEFDGDEGCGLGDAKSDQDLCGGLPGERRGR